MKTAKAQELLGRTLQLLSSGQLKEAQRACRKALQARPDLPEAHLLLSEIHHQSRDAASALESATRALRLRPGWSEAYLALGNAEALAENFAAAEAHFRSAIAAASPGVGAHANLGHVLRRQGRLPEARDAYEQALARAPEALELQLNLADILSELGEKERAADRLSATAEQFRASPQAHFALGNALADLQRHEEAISRYRRALELDASFPAAHFNLARALYATGRKAEAIAALYQLLGRDPAATDARDHLLRFLHASRRYREMEAVAREGTAVHPTEILYARQVAVALWWQERYDDAIAAFEAIDALAGDRNAPAYRDAKTEHGTSLLSLGRWTQGWEAYGWRSARSTWRSHFPKLVDDPRAIAARRPTRIVIIGDQGLGDEIFFLRFARRLVDRGHRLCGGFNQRLLPIFAAVPDLFDALTSIEEAQALEADAVILASDLPLATAQDFAPPLVLPVEAARRATFEARLREFGPPPYIGVTWRAGVLPDERVPGTLYLAKELKPEELGAVLRPIRATFVILQRRPLPEDEERFVAGLGRPALDLSAVNDDLRDALAVLSVLDDYVALSNTNIHLRAAVPGKRARVLAPSPAEWRWGLNSSVSPWFPEFRIYRQNIQAGWAPAFEALALDLAASVAA